MSFALELLLSSLGMIILIVVLAELVSWLGKYFGGGK